MAYHLSDECGHPHSHEKVSQGENQQLLKEDEIINILQTSSDKDLVKRSLCMFTDSVDSWPDKEIRNQMIEFHLDTVIKCLEVLLDAPSFLQVVSLVGETLESEKVMCKLVRADFHQRLLNVLQTETTLSEESIVIILKVLLALCSFRADLVQTYLVKNNFLENQLAPIMSSNCRNEDIHHYGLAILRKVVHHTYRQHQIDPEDGLCLNDMNETDPLLNIPLWFQIVHDSLLRFMDHENIQMLGCRVIAIILENRPNSSCYIGEHNCETQELSISQYKKEAPLQKIPLHCCCLGALLSCIHHSGVFAAACDAIYWISADNSTLSSELMKRNCHIAIIMGLQQHLRIDFAVESGARAVKGLCLFNKKHPEKFVTEGIQSVLNEAINCHLNKESVLFELLCTLAFLAQLDMVNLQCFVDEIHIKLIKLLSVYESPDFIEVSMELLLVMCMADNGVDLLLYANALEIVTDVMRKKNENLYIQKKGLILLQQLGYSDSIHSNKNSLSRLANTIGLVMQTHDFDHMILKEGCVAVQILSEKHGVSISELFVEEGCHEIIFSILQSQLDNPQVHELQELASECLYVLGNQQTLKSKMLIHATKSRNVAAVECLLEMGADVNYLSQGYTPLSYAVHGQDISMVQVLLKHHISDLKTPFKQSLERKNPAITGLLLSCINKDREGLTVSWSGLELKEIHHDWFKYALSGYGFMSAANTNSREILKKIGKVKEKRKTRLEEEKLKNSQSDGSLLTRRQSFFKFEPSKMQKKDQPPVNGSLVTSYSSIEIGSTQTVNKVVLDKNSRHLSYELPGPANFLIGSNSLSRGYHDNSLETIPCSPPGGEEVFLNREKEEQEDNVFLASNMESKSTEESMNATFDGDNASDNSSVEISYADLDEWNEITLSGVNPPYNVADPRGTLGSRTSSKIIGGKWRRKHRTVSLNSSAYSEQQEVALRSTRGRKRRGHCSFGVRPFSDLEREEIGRAKVRHFSDGGSPHFSGWDSHSDADSYSSSQCQHPLYLDLSCNKLTSIQALVKACSLNQASLGNITKLYLNENQIMDIPEDISKEMLKLECIDLQDNCLQTFPYALLGCHQLSHVDLSNNQIVIDPEMEPISNTSLKELNLSHNNISEFPYWITDTLLSLETLHLSNNHIKSLSNNPLGMSKLRHLNLSNNNIAVLSPNFLKGCHKLEVLELANNLLKSIEGDDISIDLMRLTKLKLNKNMLLQKEPFFIPKFILELPCLRSLDISENCLIGLPPPCLWKTLLLKDLNVSKNYIMKLNFEGARIWNKLEALNVSNNLIKELPKEIGQMTSLTSLDISYNKEITCLPDELGMCSKMWEMPLKGVGFTPDSIHKGKVKDIIVFLHNKLKKARRYYRMKLMVVGYGGRGKTSLLRALMKNYKSQQDTTATVGVVVKDWKFERNRRDHDGSVLYTLNTWDFAGQEEFYSSHQCYLTNLALYLVVFNLKRHDKELEKLKAWISNIHARAPGCPIIIVGTHLDKLNQTQRKTAFTDIHQRLKDMVIRYGFPDVQDFFMVDCLKETSDMERLREFIKEKVDSFSVKGKVVMGQKVPADYVRLSEVLEEEASHRKFPILTKQQLVALVQKHQIRLQLEEIDQAVRFLHEVGVVLHYEETASNLKDLYFIDPGWLCRMMAQVVTVHSINPFIKDGIMNKRDMKILFPGKSFHRERYLFPPDLIPQYIKLLEKFEIVLPYSKDKLLIPCHLPCKKPDIANYHDLKKNEIIHRVYVMPVTPIGMWSRLLNRLIIFCHDKLTQTLIDERNPIEVTYWKEGIYVYWNKKCFFQLNSSKSGDEDEIRVTVPASNKGTMLLGMLVDHIDALVEEWYPGLTLIDPFLGKELLQKKVPCILCPEDEVYRRTTTTPVCKLFDLEDLLTAADRQEVSVQCEVHGGVVTLAQLAPDIVLNDFPAEFHIDKSKFLLKETPENLLGDGGYGSVYLGQYQEQNVAVKVFNENGVVHPHKLQRQEATILRCLHHPNVLPLMGISLNPRIIVLELAPKGSLGGILSGNRPLHRHLQQKIALQVAEGLSYLHSLKILYRDMKPDNVLIYSLDTNVQINAKIADYGIARFTTFDGLISQEGTPAYRAPEVIRGENYSFEADIFSYGITLYALLTHGRHPYDQFEFKSEMDRAIAEGLPVPPVTQKGCQPWPDMESIVSECLQQIPDQRPQAVEICQILQRPELFCLKSFVFVSKAASLECFAAQRTQNSKLMVWLATGDCEKGEIARLNLMENSLKQEGVFFKHGKILCLEVIDHQYVVVGGQGSRIWVYNNTTKTFKCSTCLLDDHVLCMKHMKGPIEDLLFAGLANGHIAIFTIPEILSETNVSPMQMATGSRKEPVCCMEVYRPTNELFASLGTRVLVISTHKGITFVNKIETADYTRFKKESHPIVYQLALGPGILAVSHKGHSYVHVWKLGKTRAKKKTRFQQSLDLTQMFNLENHAARVTALTIQHENKIVWVGTGGGSMALIDLKTFSPITIIHRYSFPVRSLLYVKSKGKTKNPIILSGGTGFFYRPGAVSHGGDYSCLAVWDAHYDSLTRNLPSS